MVFFGAKVNRLLLTPAFLCLLMLAACAPQDAALRNGRWVDLTHSFSAETIYWPNADHFKLEKVYDGHAAGGYHYSANRYSAAEHGGTHMDAPIHFDIKGQTVEKIGIEQTIGSGVVIDVTANSTLHRDYLVGPGDFLAFEAKQGRIPKGSIVLIRTGYDRFWPDARQYLGTDERGESAIPKLHFPGLSPEGARWLVEQRDVRAVGLDTASIDYGQSRLFESHRILALHAVPIFENLKGLDQLPVTGALVVALPMKIEGGSGAPLRAIAFITDNP
jgi:kynurenine formamidase